MVMVGPVTPGWRECVIWDVAWIITYATLAAMLLALTLATFDRNVGRVPDQPRAPLTRLRRGRTYPEPGCRSGGGRRTGVRGDG
jgi:hypothetical protein